MKCQEIDKQISKRLWGREQDQLLLQVISRHQVIKWSQVADQFNKNSAKLTSQHSSHSFSKRTNKQCRERWQNHLNPQLRNDLPWLAQQRALLFKLFKQCSHQWCRISQRLSQNGFPKRGDNNIKNYFYSAIKRAVRLINGHIQDHNRNIKKRKSELYNYHQKYAYKKRLSLERQIIEANAPLVKNVEETVADAVEGEGLKIIRELDQEIINKILLIAELKGEKKFTGMSEEFQAQAGVLRNTIIDFLQDETTMNAEQAVTFARSLLQISRKCKRKAQRINKEIFKPEPIQQASSESQSIKQEKEEPSRHQSPKQIFGQTVPSILSDFINKNKPFNETQILEKLMLHQEERPSKVQIIHNNIPEEHSAFFLNSFANTSEAVRTYLEQSSEFLYNSGQYSQYSQKYACVPQYSFDHITFGQPDMKINFGQALDVREIKNPDLCKPNREENAPNAMQFNFLSSIRQVKPVNNLQPQTFDFDMGAHGLSFIAQPLLRQDTQLEQGSEHDRHAFFNSQPYLVHRESNSHQSVVSHRSNRSRAVKREGDREQEIGVDLLSSQHLLLRSWAFSQHNRGEGRGCLFNSSDYELKREFPMDMKLSSNFQPFQ